MAESMPRVPRHAGPQRTGSPPPDTDDPCRVRRTAAEPVACPDCGAVQEAGRWRWREALPGTGALRCPACRRLRERLPAGQVQVSGAFLLTHRDEVMARIRHIAEWTRKRYVLQRLMEIDEDDSRIRITTTSPHLARAIGLALHDAFSGTLDLDAQAQGCPRVHWSR